MKKIIESMEFARLLILTITYALYIPFALIIFMYIGFFLVDISELLAYGCSYLVVFGIPILISLMTVNKMKWWLISLPFQYLIYFSILSLAWFSREIGIGSKMLVVLFWMGIQVLSVLVKMIFRTMKRMRCKNK